MDKYTALSIIEEFQRYRRSEPPYDGDTPETHERFPYSGKVIGEALDVLMEYCRKQFIKNNTEYTQTIDELSGKLQTS